MSKLRSHLTYANVMASIAVFIALGGTSVAAVSLKKNSVGTKQLRNNAVTSTKVKNRSLVAGDFKAGQLKQGPKGSTGMQGPKGDAGTPGPKGDAGTPAFKAWARILNNGTTASVAASSGNVTAVRSGTGFVNVTVPGTNVNSCALVATPDNDGAPGFIRKASTVSIGSTYALETRGIGAGTPVADYAFDIAVFC